MIIKAVVDRFEGNKAVILVGDGSEQLVVNRAKLPAGVREGSWLRADIADDVLLSAELDEEETDNARARIRSKLDTLRSGKHRGF